MQFVDRFTFSVAVKLLESLLCEDVYDPGLALTLGCGRPVFVLLGTGTIMKNKQGLRGGSCRHCHPRSQTAKATNDTLFMLLLIFVGVGDRGLTLAPEPWVLLSLIFCLIDRILLLYR